MRFASKIDLWLWVTLAFTLGACAFAVGTAGVRGPAMLAVCALAAGLPLWVVLGTRYALTEHDLLIRSGPFRWRIPLQEVRAVAHSRSWLSSPALSLDRLRITYGRASSILISPRDKLRFLSELQPRCPGIAVASH